VLSQIQKPTLHISDRNAVLRLPRAAIPLSDCEPGTNNRARLVSKREINDPMKVRNAAFLPLSKPMKANHAGAAEANNESLTEFLPVF
jgi:hypothetical protein